MGNAMPGQLCRPRRPMLPSIRTFAQHAGISKSAAGRDLAALVDTGHITRKRRPGGVYVYRVDRRFLPKWPKRKVSQDWDGQTGVASSRQSDRSIGAVPAQGTKEKPNKKNQGWARGRAQFAKPTIVEQSCPMTPPNGKHGSAVANPTSGCRSGVQSRVSPTVGRPKRCSLACNRTVLHLAPPGWQSDCPASIPSGGAESPHTRERSA